MSAGNAINHKNDGSGNPLCGSDQPGYVWDEDDQVTCRACQLATENIKLYAQLASMKTSLNDFLMVARDDDWHRATTGRQILFFEAHKLLCDLPQRTELYAQVLDCAHAWHFQKTVIAKQRLNAAIGALVEMERN